MTDDRYQLLRLLEAILFAATEPMSEDQLSARMPEGADINGLLQELKDHYANRGVHLLAFEDRWAFRTAPDLASKFHIEDRDEEGAGVMFQFDERAVADPIRRRNQHLVPRAAQRGQDVVNRVLRAVRDDDLVRLVLEAVVPFIGVADRLLELGQTARRGVVRVTGRHRRIGRVADVLWGLEIRLSEREVVHRDARAFELARLRGGGDRGGRLQHSDGGGQSHDGAFRNGVFSVQTKAKSARRAAAT